MRHVRTAIIGATAAALALAGVTLAGDAPSSDATLVARTAPAAHLNRVLAISIDGLNPAAISQLGPAQLPHLHRLMRQGASTLNARTSYESTSTLPNHTSMLTSRTISPATAGHGVMFNDDKTATTVHRAAGRYVASVFDVVHDRGHRTALYTSKDKFALYNRSWDRRNGAVDRVKRNNGRDKISRFVFQANEDTLTSRLISQLRSKRTPVFTLLHLSNTDKTGHARGYMGPEYLAALRGEDARLGRLLAAIDRTPKLRKSLAVILTSDHGGLGTNHSDATQAVNYRVPFMVWGRGIKAADLYALNAATRQDPGTDRPSYAVAKQPVRNGEVGNLALDLLDLPAIPGSQVNARKDLRVIGR